MSAKPHVPATRQLKKRLGASVDTSKHGCWAASFDSSKISFLPEAVITPRKEKEVGILLELANKHRVPVTVRGRGTTLMGSAAPVRGGWVIDMRKLKGIKIDADAGLAHAGAGATTGDIQRAAAAQGWFYPPDPSSKEYCTIGGNIACNAGGMHGGKYGVTRDFVIALRGFLPTGEFVEWGTATKKFAAGFNLRDLWIGSEGMLGVVTGAEPSLAVADTADRRGSRGRRGEHLRGGQPTLGEQVDRLPEVTVGEPRIQSGVEPGRHRHPGVDQPADHLRAPRPDEFGRLPGGR